MPAYSDFFSRNLGVVTEGEQARLRAACVGIAGNGGVGGVYALTLARMGVGTFHLADFDVFEAANFNRQQGATTATLGRPKTEVLREMILAINPEAQVTLFKDGITTGSIGAFLQGANLVMDGLDFYALPARRILFPAAERAGIHVVTSGPIGLTTTLHVFGPGAMPFEEYFDFRSCRSRVEELASFVVGVTPGLLQLGQVDVAKIDFAAQRAPSFATAIQLCAGLACNEATRVLLGRGTPFLAPRYFQFDPVRLKIAKGRLLLGNRGPWQRFKRRLVLRQFQTLATPAGRMIERAKTWAGLAGHAPSGDNSQPWAVGLAAAGDRVTLTLTLNDATRAKPSLFDCAFVASYLSLGAFARNFIQLAESEGHSLTDLRETDGRFTLAFAPAGSRPDSRAPVDVAALIRRRTTNRLPFKQDPVDDPARQALHRLATEGGLGLREYAGPAKARLASLFYGLDLVRYRNARLYREFLEELRFGAEATRSPDGLRDTTLGAPAPALLFLRLLRALKNVRAVRALFYLGLERVMAAIGCLVPIKNSAAVFVLTSSDDSPLGWFRLGLGFEQVWLEVTRRDLALQPLGTTLLVYRLEREQRLGEPSSFAPADAARLRALAGRFRTEFGLDLARPAIAFRVGRGPAITNTSLRRPVVVNTPPAEI